MKNFSALCIFLFFFTSIFAQQKPDALKLYNAGKYKEAISACEKELEKTPENMDSYVVLCWSLVKNKQYTEAEMRAGNALMISKYDHRIIEILGEAKYHLGKNNEALSLFQEYISLVPTTGSRLGAVYYYVVEIYILQGKFEHADIALSQAVMLEPLKESWWIRLGYAREMTRTWTAASEAYQKALDLNPLLDDAKRGKERVMAKIR